MSIETVLLLIIVGLAAGVLSGMVGVGGGIIVVPALVIFLGFSQHQAQGTSLGLLLLPVGILAVMNYYNKGYIDIKVVAIMSIALYSVDGLAANYHYLCHKTLLRKYLPLCFFYWVLCLQLFILHLCSLLFSPFILLKLRQGLPA